MLFDFQTLLFGLLGLLGGQLVLLFCLLFGLLHLFQGYLRLLLGLIVAVIGGQSAAEQIGRCLGDRSVGQSDGLHSGAAGMRAVAQRDQRCGCDRCKEEMREIESAGVVAQ
ncbi:hypothetical protein AWC13_11080 [Mycobacterium kubicae]|nr:hypothetical protein A5725_24255 [Mycobacterium kubicae]ORV99285.1 hypothetical protein AWC13_11080 [Mycobacterium kubicae]